MDYNTTSLVETTQNEPCSGQWEFISEVIKTRRFYLKTWWKRDVHVMRDVILTEVNGLRSGWAKLKGRRIDCRCPLHGTISPVNSIKVTERITQIPTRRAIPTRETPKNFDLFHFLPDTPRQPLVSCERRSTWGSSHDDHFHLAAGTKHTAILVQDL